MAFRGGATSPSSGQLGTPNLVGVEWIGARNPCESVELLKGETALFTPDIDVAAELCHLEGLAVAADQKVGCVLIDVTSGGLWD